MLGETGVVVKRFFVVLTSVLVLAAPVLLASPASANQVCTGYQFRSLGGNTTTGYAGQQVSTTIRFTTDDTCVTSVRFRFVSTGGQGVQTIDAAPQYEGGGVVAATANWVPAAASYQLQATVYYYSMTLGWGYGAVAGPTFYYSIGTFADAPVPAGLGTPTLAAEDRTVTVSWTAPTTNGSAVSKYRVTNALNGQQVCETNAGTSSCRFDGLPEGSYAYQVTALNALGKGATSDPTPIIKVAPPIAPVITQVQSKGTQVTLRWNTATDSIAVPRVYRVHNSAGTEVCGVAVTPADLTAGSMTCAPRLTAGSTTQFVVSVETALGNASSVPTPAVTGTDPTRSKSCTTAKTALQSATKSKNRSGIAAAKRRVTAACVARIINY